MRVALGRAGLLVPEHLADQVQAIAASHGDRREAMPKVMQSSIGKLRRRPDALPRVLDTDEVALFSIFGLARPVCATTAARGREHERIALLSGELGQQCQRGGAERYDLLTRLAVREAETARFDVDMIPLERHDFR